MRCSRHIAAALLWACTAAPAAQSDLGVIGPVYPIAEADAVEALQRKLKAMEKSGELQRIQREGAQRAERSARNPAPVPGLALVQARSQRLLDPTVTYRDAVRTEDGSIVIPAGTRINPLEIVGLTKRLVFFDGRDPDQSEAVRAMVAKGGTKVRPILVAGSWFDLSKAWQTQVFFDQHGRLSERFGIRAVPSVISQQGNKLMVEEVPAKELK